MPAVRSRLRSGEIVVQMQEARARDMRRGVLGASARRVGQIVAAIEDDPVGIGEMLREDFSADQRGEDHALIIV